MINDLSLLTFRFLTNSLIDKSTSNQQTMIIKTFQIMTSRQMLQILNDKKAEGNFFQEKKMKSRARLKVSHAINFFIS